MNFLEIAFVLVACHALGDYVLQIDYLAKTKGANWYHMVLHCILYAVPFYLAFGFCWQLALITIMHFPIDALKARWGKTTYWQDQVAHYILLLSYLM